MSMISDKRVVQEIVALLEAAGIRDIIITPGSRNAPFSISLHDHPSFRVHSIVDERSAAFAALGMAQQSRRPSVLICTSGTAALNFAPAIAEAYYQRVPLLVITADRPLEWIDQGEGQSIRQDQVFANYVRASFTAIQESGDQDGAWFNNRIVNEAILACTGGTAGPVHLNVPLRESLYGVVPASDVPSRLVRRAAVDAALSAAEKSTMEDRISTTDRVLVLAGQLAPDPALHAALLRLSQLPQVVVMTETHSNLSHESWIGTIDRTILRLEEDALASLAPQLVITIGENIISRRVKAWLRTSLCEHWHVDASGQAPDTYQHLTTIVPLAPGQWLSSIHPRRMDSDYRDRFLAVRDARRRAAEQWLPQAAFSDLTAIVRVMQRVPGDYDIQMGNSAVVRYIQLTDPRADLRYFGNRGVSGIDGCTSTAIGAAYASGRDTLLLSGDVAFLYDSNAFWNDLVPPHLKIVVVNNSGGGIFRIIEGPSTTPALDTYFETTHSRSAAELATMYRLPFRSAANRQELDAGLDWLFGQPGCAVLEIHTPRLENDGVLRDFFSVIKMHSTE